MQGFMCGDLAANNCVVFTQICLKAFFVSWRFNFSRADVKEIHEIMKTRIKQVMFSY
jgi:hypothetical protein